MTEKHSPLPWAHRTGLENDVITDADEDIVCRMPNHPENGKLWHLDAPLIVRSVNGLPEAIAALEQVHTISLVNGVVDPVQHRNMLNNIERISRAALTKLKG